MWTVVLQAAETSAKPRCELLPRWSSCRLPSLLRARMLLMMRLLLLVTQQVFLVLLVLLALGEAPSQSTTTLPDQRLMTAAGRLLLQASGLLLLPSIGSESETGTASEPGQLQHLQLTAPPAAVRLPPRPITSLQQQLAPRLVASDVAAAQRLRRRWVRRVGHLSSRSTGPALVAVLPAQTRVSRQCCGTLRRCEPVAKRKRWALKLLPPPSGQARCCTSQLACCLRAAWAPATPAECGHARLQRLTGLAAPGLVCIVWDALASSRALRAPTMQPALAVAIQGRGCWRAAAASPG